MSGAWYNALAELEARLDAIAAGLELADTPPDVEFVVPAVDGPLPAALQDRATAIVERGAELRARLEAEAADIAAELRRLPRRRPTQSGTSLFEVGA